MTFDLTEPDYPQITIKDDHVLGISMWVEKMIEMTDSSHSKGEWNVMVADIWPNDKYSRLIGLVQMSNVAVGYDTGFRVCAYLSNGGIVGDSGDDMPLIKSWLNTAIATPRVQAALTKRSGPRPFEIRLTENGRGPINQATQIIFEDTPLRRTKRLKPSLWLRFLLWVRARLT